MILKLRILKSHIILSVVKRNPLFLHEIIWKNNGFLFTTPNIMFFFLLYLSINSLKFDNYKIMDEIIYNDGDFSNYFKKSLIWNNPLCDLHVVT